MKSNIKEISNELKGEMLICDDNRSIYEEDEQELIVTSIAKRLSSNPNYMALIPECHDKLCKVANACIKKPSCCIDAMEIMFKITRFNRMSVTEQGEENSYESYNANIRYGHFWQEPYSYVIAHRLLDVEEISRAYESETAFDQYKGDINFLITNNILLTRNPDFFDRSALDQLETIAKYRDRKNFYSHRQYFEFKRAANITLKNLKNFRKQKVKYKAMPNS